MKFTKEQADWLIRYDEEVGFSAVLLRDEFHSGEVSFEEFAFRNTRWIVRCAEEKAQALEDSIPRADQGGG